MKKSWLMLVVVLLAFSCKKGYDHEPEQKGLSLSDGFLLDDMTILAPTGDTVVFTFVSSKNWSITKPTNYTWFHLDRESGSAGVNQITIIADGNFKQSDRSATFSIWTSEKELKALSFSQAYAYLRINQDNFQFEWYEDGSAPKTMNIVSNLNWVIRGADGAIFDVSTSQGSGDASVLVSPHVVNYGDGPLVGDFDIVPVIYKSDGSYREVTALTQTVRMSQNNLYFVTDASRVQIGELNDSVRSVRIETTENQQWTIDCDASWLKTSYPSGGKGSASLQIYADSPNPTTKERTGVISIIPKGCVDERSYHKIVVTQKAYVFDVRVVMGGGSDTITFDSNDKTIRSISLATTGAWEVENIPDWLNVSPKKSLVNATQTDGKLFYQIQVAPKSVNKDEQREAYLVFKPLNLTEQYHNLYRTIIVVQKGAK